MVPEDSAEVRRVTVTNNSDEPREIELTSYGEIVLAPPEADRAHPGVRQPVRGDRVARVVYRDHRHPPSALRRRAAALVRARGGLRRRERVGPVTCETDRARFLGRGRSTRDPVALDEDGAAVRHDRRGARSDLRAAHPGAGSDPGQSAVGRVHHAGRHQPGAGLRAGRPLPRSARGAARARPRLDLEPGRAARARPHAGGRRGLPGARRPPASTAARRCARPRPSCAGTPARSRCSGRTASPATGRSCSPPSSRRTACRRCASCSRRTATGAAGA